jgi:FG-GAP-like repeat
VLLGNGDGTFQPVVSYSSGGNTALSVAVADVNGDGKSDLLVGNQCDTSSNCAHGLLGVLLGNGDGTFRPAVTYDAGGTGVWSVAVADVNVDHKLDLVMAIAFFNKVAVLLGNGDGTFQAAMTYGSGGIPPPVGGGNGSEWGRTARHRSLELLWQRHQLPARHSWCAAQQHTIR